MTLFVLSFLWRADAFAEDERQPLWEIGMIAGFVSLPHYIGSDQRYSVPLALPYFVYRGERLRVNRDGMRGLLWSGSRFSIDIGLSFDPPVYSVDNEARSGMPDIPWSGEIGPRLLALLYKSESGWQALARIPYRRVGDINGKSTGWIMEPNLLVSSEAPIGGWGGYIDLGLLYGSQKYNNTYYGVAEEYETADRPAYSARGGYHSSFGSLGLKYRASRALSMGLYIKARFLDGGAVEGSPLTRERRDISFGLWLAWSLWESEQKVSKADVLNEPDENAY